MVEVKNISVAYSDRNVLRNVSLSIKKGEVLALVGPNGCGKSTLLRTILGYLPVSEGEIRINGNLIQNLSPKEVAHTIAYLPQNRPIPNITAERMILHGRFPYLGYPRHYRRVDYDVVKWALQRTSSEQLSHRMISELSGGERQRIYCSMALAQSTPIIFMDEPTTYLDISHQIEMMRLIRELAEEGKTVVVVLHDLSLAMRYADRVALLSDGQLIACETPDLLYADPILEHTFGVRLCRISAEDGWRYYYG